MSNFIFGKSKEMESIQKSIEKISRSELPIFIEGETGTGKTLLAKEIHNLSKRSSGNFCMLDCATVPSSLAESELFGHERGAFTGAHETKPGIFETVNGGTVLLDEIENLSLPIQAKLLTILEDKKLRRVGGIKNIEVDFRLISATNDHILDKIQNGDFRRDLFHRLHGTKLYLPPLRDRKEDIYDLTEHFLEQYNIKNNCNKELSKEVRFYLESYFWPGNVRELEFAIEEAAVKSSDNQIQLENFSLDLQKDFMLASSGENQLCLSNVEKKYIEIILKSVDFNKSSAARILGIGLNTIFRKIAKYEIMEGE